LSICQVTIFVTMTCFTKDTLQQFSKTQLIEIIITIQEGNEVEIKLPIKNSTNSSIPSSKDIAKKETESNNKSKIIKPHGGPKHGHAGISRKTVANPDIIIFKKIEICPRTGELINSNSKSFHIHQIIELLPAAIKVIEIQRQTTTGPDGKTIIAPNPDGIQNHQKFGPYLKSFIATLRFRFHMEWDNIRAFFELFYTETISKGAMNSIFNQLRDEFQSEYNQIGEEIKKNAVVGADETGARIDGKKYWSWVFRTDELTQFKVADNRSHSVVQETLGEDFSGTLVTDFFGAYSDKFFPDSQKQKCIAHLSRDVKFGKEINNDETGFPSTLLNILNEALKVKKEGIFNSPSFVEKRLELETKLDQLIRDEKICKNKIEKRLQKRLIKNRKDIFTFLYNDQVPPDNNGSERDIRKWVIFRKIYGCFRSKEGAENTAVIMSIMDTCKKKKVNFFEKILNAFDVSAFRSVCKAE